MNVMSGVGADEPEATFLLAKGSELLQIFLYGAARLGKMDQDPETAEGPEEAWFAVCLHCWHCSSALLCMESTSAPAIRQAALGEGEGSKRGHGLMLLCVPEGKDLSPARRGDAKDGLREQLWLL